MFDALCPAIYKQLRKRAGMTQAQLAIALDTSRMTVMRFENGRSRPEKRQEEKLKELAKCSDVEFLELVCKEASEQTDRRFGLLNGEGGYRPATALAAGYALLDRRGDELEPERIRTMRDKISMTQSAELIFRKSANDLMDYVRRCKDQLEG